MDPMLNSVKNHGSNNKLCKKNGSEIKLCKKSWI